MADDVASLRAEIEALRAELKELREYVTPVVEQHQPGPPAPLPVSVRRVRRIET
jgi:hypothetical protein